MPLQLTHDKRIDLDHLYIYMVMSGRVKYGTNICDLGQREIGNVLEMSQMTVSRRQDELAAWGHIRRIEQPNGKRGLYEMLSPVFEVKAKASRPDPQRKARNSVARQAADWAKITAGRAQGAG